MFVQNLPKFTQNAIAAGILLLAGSLSYQILRSTDLELSVANSKLQTSTQLLKTQQLLTQLDQANSDLKEQQEQIEFLKNQYSVVLEKAEEEGKKAYGLRKLKPTIDKIEEPTQDLDAIADTISDSQSKIEELIEK